MPDGARPTGNQPDVAATVASLVELVIADDLQRQEKRHELLALAKRWDEVAPEIDSPGRADKVADIIIKLRDAHEAEEAARVAAKAPFFKACKDIDAAFGPRRDNLILAKGGMERRQDRWLKRLKVQQAEEAARLKREAEVAAAAGRAEQAEVLAERAEATAAAVPVVRSQTGARVSTRKHRVLAVDDLALVPREYLILDETKAKAALVSGTAIPGLRLVDDERISTRR